MKTLKKTVTLAEVKAASGRAAIVTYHEGHRFLWWDDVDECYRCQDENWVGGVICTTPEVHTIIGWAEP